MVAAGIAVAVIAAVCNAVSVAVQAGEARSAPAERAMRASLFRWLIRRPRWLAATLLLILTGALQVLALALAPLTVVQPTLATGYLVLLALARFRLGERVGRPEVLAAVAVIAGLTAVIAAAPPPD